MNLGTLWTWEKQKLPCRIRQESGNPAIDDLRERVAELAGINLAEFLDDTAAGAGKRSAGLKAGTKAKKKGRPQATLQLAAPDGGGDTTPRGIKLNRDAQRTLASAESVLAQADSAPVSVNRNLNKVRCTALLSAMRNCLAGASINCDTELVQFALFHLVMTPTDVYTSHATSSASKAHDGRAA
jgi:hypothetical protein